MINEQDLGRELRILNIIWGALLCSLGFYLVVGFVLAGGVKPSMSEDAFSILRTVLCTAAFINVIAAGRVRKFLLSRDGQDAERPGGSPGPVIQKYLFAMIIALVMCESAGIFGLVLFILGQNELDLYGLIALAAIGMFQYRPNRDEVMALFEQT